MSNEHFMDSEFECTNSDVKKSKLYDSIIYRKHDSLCEIGFAKILGQRNM